MHIVIILSTVNFGCYDRNNPDKEKRNLFCQKGDKGFLVILIKGLMESQAHALLFPIVSSILRMIRLEWAPARPPKFS